MSDKRQYACDPIQGQGQGQGQGYRGLKCAKMADFKGLRQYTSEDLIENKQ